MDTIITKYRLDVRNIEDLWEIYYSQRPSFDVFQATKNLIDATKIYMIYEVRVFVMYGTLLGIMRDKSLIQHDTDVDLGFFDNDINSLINAHSLMVSKGFRLLRNVSENRLITYERNGQYIDLYKFEIANQLPSDSLGAYFFPLAAILPLKEKFIADGLVFVPNKSLLIVRKLYGISWRIEKKNSHFPNNKFLLKFYIKINNIIPSNLKQILKTILKKYRDN